MAALRSRVRRHHARELVLLLRPVGASGLRSSTSLVFAGPYHAGAGATSPGRRYLPRSSSP